MTIAAVPVIKNGCLIVRGKVILTGVPDNVVISPTISSTSAFIGATSATSSSHHVFNLGILESCKFMCVFIAKIWWMIPRVGKSASEIPMETQMLLLEIAEESVLDVVKEDQTLGEDNKFYVVVLPVLDGDFRTTLRGTPSNELQFCCESGDSDVQTSDALEGVFVNSGDNPFELIKDSIKFATRLTDIKENSKFRASESADDSSSSLKELIRDIKENYGLKYVYMWHALAGYWGGVLASSEALRKYNPTLEYPVQSPGKLGNIRDIAMDSLEKYGVGVVDPRKVLDFYSDMHSYLADSGVDGVKVDVQNLLETLGSGYGGRVSITKQYQQALDESVERNFRDNNLISCMCHNSDSIFSSKKSATARASEDFMPNEPTFQTLHIASVSFNSLLLGEIVVPDWDMFHSNHTTAEFHGAARALGGCPVYVSDKPGKHNFKILKKLVLTDGSILRARYAGRPTRDCLFVDPVMDGKSLLKIWNLNKVSGVVGVFNCQGSGSWPMKEAPGSVENSAPIAGRVSPGDVEFLEDVAGEAWTGDCAVYAFNSGSLSKVANNGSIEVSLDVLQCEIFTVTPIKVINGGIEFIPVGLINMYNSGGAVEEFKVDDKKRIKARGSGIFGAYSGIEPRCCKVDNKDEDFIYTSENGLLTINLEGEGCFKEIEIAF